MFISEFVLKLLLRGSDTPWMLHKRSTESGAWMPTNLFSKPQKCCGVVSK